MSYFSFFRYYTQFCYYSKNTYLIITALKMLKKHKKLVKQFFCDIFANP